MFRMTRLVFFLTLAVFVLTSLENVNAQYSRVVVFGDSLSDTGNSFAATGIPPSGPGGFPYFEGRFSNGPIWIDFVQQELGLSENQMVNFAVGGSSTGFGFKAPPDGIFETPPGTVIPTVGVQIDTYLATVGGAAPGQLTVLWAGANDLLTLHLPGSIVDNIEQHIRTLAASGSNEFLVPGQSRIGSTPAVRGTLQGFILNIFATYFNYRLNQRLDALEVELGITVHRLDTYTPNLLALIFPSLFGLTNTTNAALADIQSGVITPAEGATYLYWDVIHPTSTVHQTLAASALQVLGNP